MSISISGEAPIDSKILPEAPQVTKYIFRTLKERLRLELRISTMHNPFIVAKEKNRKELFNAEK